MKPMIDKVKKEIEKAVKGKEEIITKVLAAILAGGHIMLEDIPGVGKTTLAMSIAKSLELSYKRVQFTPDVLPSDILGFSMYNKASGEFEYKEGAAMCNLFLADEINRTSPKTQSALLEIMEEGNVTVDGVTRKLPEPFVVIATENPVGSSGTQLLPESQLDRFMICLTMGYPSHQAAIDILKENVAAPLNALEKIMSRDDLIQARKQVDEIFVHDVIYDYIVTIVEATREHDYFYAGVSPRGSIALLRMAKAYAYMKGKTYDIQSFYAKRFVGNVLYGRRISFGNLSGKPLSGFSGTSKGNCRRGHEKRGEAGQIYGKTGLYPSLEKNRHPHHASSSGGRILAHSSRGECAVRFSDAGHEPLGRNFAEGPGFIGGTSLAGKPADGWGVSDGQLGDGGDAAANGYIFPAVYFAGGFRAAAPYRLQPGWIVSEGRCPWKAGADHVGGVLRSNLFT